MNSKIEKSQEDTFNKNYFKVYENDVKREKMYRSEIQKIYKYHSQGKILDVGCGIGKFLSFFDENRWDKYGVEVSSYAIEESKKNNIQFKEGSQYDYPDSYFDVIVFRGSLQLIPEPFSIILKCIKLLKKGGLMVFLSTPNSNSPYYRRFKTLPVLHPHHNYLIPSDILVSNAITNFGLKVDQIHYPYLSGPYAKPLIDSFYYLLSYIGIKKKFAFFKSTMEIYAIK